jgi:hypothetical protein
MRPQARFRLGDLPTAAVLRQRCYPKVPHVSQGAADAHLRALQRTRTVVAGELLNTYRCRHCQ